ncbi:hypothetical protein EUV02_11255 [Polymorphobacter arshaanensis]|uniref:Uncharacterized protein n=1 Tax=Glacieibacterium arshaanense TaxID=2511025 RepID=A0A4Y9ENR0_9SPHN|nr:hypothetical protein [Polymorphobacter arshaanensis]TFU03715.1 hypothetical protein EUV02_11255 [Polymorphobacter arshaanensis]
MILVDPRKALGLARRIICGGTGVAASGAGITIGGTGSCAGCGTGKPLGCGRFHSHTAVTSNAKTKVSAIHRHMAISPFARP